MSSTIYDKRDYLNFDIVNFPFIESPAYAWCLWLTADCVCKDMDRFLGLFETSQITCLQLQGFPSIKLKKVFLNSKGGISMFLEHIMPIFVSM